MSRYTPVNRRLAGWSLVGTSLNYLAHNNFVEIAGFDVHWAEPGDLHVDEVPESITAGPDGRGLCVLFADGTVWFLNSEVPLENLKKFFTIEGAKQHDREELLAPYADGK